MSTPESPQFNPTDRQELSRELTTAESGRIKEILAQIKEILNSLGIADLIKITQEEYRKLDPETRQKLMRLSERLKRLVEKKSAWPYEMLTEEYIEKRYQEIYKMYEDTEVIDKDGKIKFEMRADDGEIIEKEYIIPSIESILGYLQTEEVQPIVEKAQELGLTRFHLVPLCGIGDVEQVENGNYTSPLTKAVAEKLIERASNHELKLKNDQRIDNLDTNQPIYFADEYKDLKYRLRSNDLELPIQTLTHQQLLEQSEKNPLLAGWKFVFTGEDPTVKRTRSANDPLSIFQANRKYDDILDDLKNKDLPIGLWSAEDELILYLEELANDSNEAYVLHDWDESQDGASWLLGNSFGVRPFVDWDRARGYLYFSWYGSDDSNGSLGAVPSVSLT